MFRRIDGPGRISLQFYSGSLVNKPDEENQFYSGSPFNKPDRENQFYSGSPVNKPYLENQFFSGSPVNKSDIENQFYSVSPANNPDLGNQFFLGSPVNKPDGENKFQITPSFDKSQQKLPDVLNSTRRHDTYLSFPSSPSISLSAMSNSRFSQNLSNSSVPSINSPISSQLSIPRNKPLSSFSNSIPSSPTFTHLRSKYENQASRKITR